MKLKELIGTLEKLAPRFYAEEWDNVGLLAGRYEKDVKRILIALDPTEAVIERAVKQEIDLLITHHPLMLAPVRCLDDEDFITRRLVKLIQHDISYYAMHTNFDNAPGCMADMAAKCMGLHNCKVLQQEGTLEDGTPWGTGVAGYLAEPMTLGQLGTFVKERFALPYVTVYGDYSLEAAVCHVGICPGSGKSLLSSALKAGVQVFITGDTGHHMGIDAGEQGLIIVDGGHYGLEHMFIPFVKEYLVSELGEAFELVDTVDASFPVLLV